MTLPPGPYSLIMADPPWTFATRSPRGITAKGAGGQYQTMTLDAIKALPVGEIAAPDCLLVPPLRALPCGRASRAGE